MRPFLRRKLDILLTLAAAALIGVAAIIGSAVGDSERVAAIWVDAELTGGGKLAVSEVIDYDFGLQNRHGIYRDIDDLDPDAAISVVSPTAPDQFVVFDHSFATQLRSRIRVGDPNDTVSGRHRYHVEFPLDTVAAGGILAWDAVGTEWAVGIERVEVLLRSDRALSSTECLTGPAGSWDTCAVEVLGPGVVSVVLTGLDAGDGITIYADLGDPVALALADDFLPTGTAPDPGIPTSALVLVAIIAALLASIPIAGVIRRLGREKVHVGGPVAAAFGGSLDGVERVDHSDLADMATTAFAPPPNISATEGSVLYLEAVPKRSLSAFIIERAIAGEIEIEGDADGDSLTLLRTDQDLEDRWRPTINKMFGQRKKISLDKYDKKFTAGRAHLKKKLESWQRESGYWNDEGQVMQIRVRVLSGIGVGVGIVGAAAGGAASARWGGIWVILLVIAAAIAGGSASSMVRLWELLVRSPAGSAMWSQIESFRRFLEGSEAQHVENAASMGVLREYTAWAIALDETRAWTKAVARAALDSPEFRSDFANDLYIAMAARSIASAASKTSTAPWSDGSGGGGFSGGGFSGGGGGGGGGGSW